MQTNKYRNDPILMKCNSCGNGTTVVCVENVAVGKGKGGTSHQLPSAVINKPK